MKANALFNSYPRIKSGRARDCLYFASDREIFEICDDVTVLRDGQFIGESEIQELSEDRLIEMMLRRRLDEQYPRIELSGWRYSFRGSPSFRQWRA